MVLYFLIVCLCTTPNVWGIMNVGDFNPSPEDRSDQYHPQILRNLYPQAISTGVETPVPIQFAVNYGHSVQHGDGTRERPQELTNIQIEMDSVSNLTGSGGQMVHFIVKNVGKEDEYIHINVSDQLGYAQEVPPTEFHLPSGSTKDISVLMNYPPNVHRDSPDIITINASGKRSTVKRSAYYYYPGNEYEYQNQQQQQQPFCYDRYVTGTCRYRMDPYDCNNYKWTAYATIQNHYQRGGSLQLRSQPEGLYIQREGLPGEGTRVYITTTCCFPVVQFLSSNPYSANTVCAVDVRELQGLNPAEIAGIVIGVIILLIIIIVIIALLIRKRRQRTVLVGHTTATTRESATVRE